MKLHIVARGKIGRGPESELVARYMERLSWPVAVTELPERGGRVPTLPDRARAVALDERGDQWSSVRLAKTLGRWRDGGARETRFVIGAADGLADDERAAADAVLSFGRATWPHLLVRAMLAEQLYRAVSILERHPYHREG